MVVLAKAAFHAPLFSLKSRNAPSCSSAPTPRTSRSSIILHATGSISVACNLLPTNLKSHLSHTITDSTQIQLIATEPIIILYDITTYNMAQQPLPSSVQPTDVYGGGILHHLLPPVGAHMLTIPPLQTKSLPSSLTQATSTPVPASRAKKCLSRFSPRSTAISPPPIAMSSATRQCIPVLTSKSAIT